ncbi:MAG TPA: DUF11 domain-containing protein, partial [Candidatus Wirthbacteria bacterium]|nr:DUF11 domain-containing protein [Candidatus Wirthbacteria bacterium]
ADGRIDADDDSYYEDLTAEFTITSRPVFRATKTATPTADAIVLQGDIISYTLTFRNTGNMIARNVMITDILDGAFAGNPTITSSSYGSGYDPDTRTVWWNIGTLDVDQSVTVSFSARIGQNVPDLTRIHNYATIYATGAVPTRTNTITHTVCPAMLVANQKLSRLVLDQNQNGRADPGDIIEYTIRIANRGLGEATDINIEDTLDSNLAYLASSPTATVDRQILGWTIDSLGSFETMDIIIHASVRSTAECDNSVVNEATISYIGAYDDETVTSITVRSIPIALCSDFAVYNLSQSYKTTDLQTDHDNNGRVDSGDIVRYTINLVNRGNSPARNVTVTDVIPPYSSLRTGSITDSGTFDSQTDTITWTGLTVNPNETKTVSFSVVIDTTGVSEDPRNPTFIRNLATITGSNNDQTIVLDPGLYVFQDPSFPIFLTSTKTATILESSNTSDPNNLNPGEIISYTITIRNTGSDANNLVIHDTLTPFVTYVSDTITPASNSDASNPQHLIWNIDRLAAGQTLTLSYQARVNPNVTNNTLVCNIAHLNDQMGRIMPIDQNICLTIVNRATLNAEKRIINLSRSDKQFHTGNRIRYEIVVTNTGTNTSNLVQISDTVSSNLEYIAGTIAGGDNRDESGNPLLKWTINSLAPNQTETLSFEATIKNDLRGGTIIGNEASGLDADGNEFTVRAPDIRITDADPTTPDPQPPGQEPVPPGQPGETPPTSPTGNQHTLIIFLFGIFLLNTIHIILKRIIRSKNA